MPYFPPCRREKERRGKKVRDRKEGSRERLLRVRRFSSVCSLRSISCFLFQGKLPRALFFSRNLYFNCCLFLFICKTHFLSLILTCFSFVRFFLFFFLHLRFEWFKAAFVNLLRKKNPNFSAGLVSVCRRMGTIYVMIF